MVGAAIAFLVAMALQCGSLSPLHDVSEACWGYITYPVTKAWRVLLSKAGGEHGMIYILPVFLTQVAFICVLGAVVGACVGRLTAGQR